MRRLIHRVFAQLVLVLTVIVILRVLQVVLLAALRAQRASGLVNSVIETRVAHAFAAAVVEPPVARGAHALAGRPTFVPGIALRHERDRAV